MKFYQSCILLVHFLPHGIAIGPHESGDPSFGGGFNDGNCKKKQLGKEFKRLNL